MKNQHHPTTCKKTHARLPRSRELALPKYQCRVRHQAVPTLKAMHWSYGRLVFIGYDIDDFWLILGLLQELPRSKTVALVHQQVYCQWPRWIIMTCSDCNLVTNHVHHLFLWMQTYILNFLTTYSPWSMLTYPFEYLTFHFYTHEIHILKQYQEPIPRIILIPS